MRGKAVNDPALFWKSGIIPAGAGKSRPEGRQHHHRRDHPRGCGEKHICCRMGTSHPGSSPRVRGKAPAHALRAQEGQDHPRGCGEKASPKICTSLSQGSSPRVRGKAVRANLTYQQGRIIPAGAGKSLFTLASKRAWWDHPRGCGEKHIQRRKLPVVQGSSPRVRGKDVRPRRCRLGRRIIPAGAGKSRAWRRNCSEFKDHPRGCGEKLDTLQAAPGDYGSSPRVRGKGVDHSRHCDGLGIIPAGAGKSPEDPDETKRIRDHPRGCGEKLRMMFAVWKVMGSSPRVRGKAPRCSSTPRSMGIIPAGAGKRLMKALGEKGCGRGRRGYSLSLV